MSNAVISEMPSVVAKRARLAAPIKAHLAVAGISGAELARRIGLSQSQVSRRLSTNLPFDVDDLIAIADELNITVVELLQMPRDDRRPGGGTTLLGAGIRKGHLKLMELPEVDSNHQPAG